MPHIDDALAQSLDVAVKDPLLLKTFAKEIDAEAKRLYAGFRISREHAERRAVYGVLRVEAQMRAVHKNAIKFVPASSVGRFLTREAQQSPKTSLGAARKMAL